MLRTIVLAVVAFALSAVLWVSQCSGPRPIVVGAPRVQAPVQPGDKYTVETTIRNQGKGHGEVHVTVRLISEDSPAVYQQDESVQLQENEEVRSVVEIPAPPGTYDPQVEVEYPPR